MGELLRLMGKLSEAESCFREALRLVPNDPGYMSVLGQIMVQQGKAVEGLELCRTAARIGANNASGAFLAWEWCWRSRNSSPKLAQFLRRY